MTMPVSNRSLAGAIMHHVNPKSQEGKVLLHLIRVGSITQLVALELYRVHRLASRVSALKLKYGVSVYSTPKFDATGTRYHEYSL
jgi:hypothetical protein